MERVAMTKLTESHNPASSPAERRKFKRLPLHLPVRLSRPKASPIHCTTENISSEGFYCVSPDPVVPGERLDVEIALPAHSPGRYESRVRLKCQAVVVRVHSTWLGSGFGIGCRIENYSFRLQAGEL
jgi:hypothetical protein